MPRRLSTAARRPRPRGIIDDGILPRNTQLVVELAVVLAGLALADAALSLWQRWISALIGEALIFDMRTQVFAHFQRMPIAFPRTSSRKTRSPKGPRFCTTIGQAISSAR